jgi:hypothetical protein
MGWIAAGLLAAPSLLESDAAKLLLVAAAAAVVFVLARAFSESGAEIVQAPREPIPFPAAKVASPVTATQPGFAFRSPADLPEPDLGSLQIRNFYFSAFDALSGPPDPTDFCDELFVQLYDADTDHGWTESYQVGTPRGLARVLAEKNWDSAFVNSMLVVRVYDRQEIRRAIVEQIAEQQELARSGKLRPDPGPMLA